MTKDELHTITEDMTMTSPKLQPTADGAANSNMTSEPQPPP